MRFAIKEPQTDKELVDRCNNGDRPAAIDAFNTLYQRHKAYVAKVAIRYCADQELALDVIQETFSYLLNKFPPPGEGLRLTAKFTTFLYPVIKHLTLDRVKKNRRFVSDEQIPEESEHMMFDPMDRLGGLLKDLSPDRCEVVLLRFVDGYQLEEIAGMLEIPVGTVKSRIHLAIKQLKKSPDTKKFFES